MKEPEEIKKGLEACIAGECNSKRITCPYRKEGDCTTAVVVDALALINQLEARLVETNKTSDDLRAKLAEYEKALVPLPEPPEEDGT